MENQFIGYIGDSKVHDSVITNFEYQDSNASVAMKAQSGRLMIIEFNGVVSIESNKPEGMMLYSISEMSHPEHRLFSFVNWSEEDDAYLEIIASNYKIIK